MGCKSTTWPLLAPSVSGSDVIRGGRLSSARVSPAALLKSRSRFQTRSPIFSMSSGEPMFSPHTSLSIAMTSVPGSMSNVENRQMPAESTNDVVFCMIDSQYGFSSVVNGSSLTGLPKCSTDTV